MNLKTMLTLSFALGCTSALAQVTVTDPWVRGTVDKQPATGAFMQLQAAKEAKLVSASSPVAATVEVHEMAMDGSVMRMRAIPSLALPAGKVIELKPGGYHVMLMGLKKTLKEGDRVPLTLLIEAADRTRSTLEVDAPVKALTASAPAQGGGHHKH